LATPFATDAIVAEIDDELEDAEFEVDEVGIEADGFPIILSRFMLF